MFQNFFRGDNPIFRFTGRVLDVLVLSGMWLVCSLPVVTVGAASAALYYSCVKCLRFHEGRPYRSFWEAFRLNLRTGTGATVILLLIGLLLDAGYLFLVMAAGTGSPVWETLRIAYLAALLVPLAVVTCAFPLLSRFTCTTGGLLRSAVIITFRHLPRTLGAAAVNAACIAATVWGWYYGVILLTPALSALASSFLLEPVLRKYTPAPAEGEETPWYLR